MADIEKLINGITETGKYDVKAKQVYGVTHLYLDFSNGERYKFRPFESGMEAYEFYKALDNEINGVKKETSSPILEKARKQEEEYNNKYAEPILEEQLEKKYGKEYTVKVLIDSEHSYKLWLYDDEDGEDNRKYVTDVIKNAQEGVRYFDKYYYTQRGVKSLAFWDNHIKKEVTFKVE